MSDSDLRLDSGMPSVSLTAHIRRSERHRRVRTLEESLGLCPSGSNKILFRREVDPNEPCRGHLRNLGTHKQAED